MKAPLFGKIAILGTGLIGGSLAAAIRQRDIACHVAAYDRSQEALDFLSAHKLAHSVHNDLEEAVRDTSLVVLAVPPDALAALTLAIAPHLPSDCIVTDVASVKRQAIEAVASRLPASVCFVPGHPIAGSERSGAQAADANLFEDKKVVLTPSEAQVLSEAVSQVRNLWEAMGAKVEYMPPELHDRIYAYVSHLPQMLAYAAYPSVKGSSDAECAGVLRLAHSNPALWADICLANADYIREGMDEYATFLAQMIRELQENADQAESAASEKSPAALTCAVISLCLVATALLLEQHTGLPVRGFGGRGFKDMTVSAGTQSDNVLEAISAQPSAVAALLEHTLNRLQSIAAALSTGNRENLLKAFSY